MNETVSERVSVTTSLATRGSAQLLAYLGRHAHRVARDTPKGMPGMR
ncbi:hypothetical protein [Propionivibrio sp.]|nr:hypothetical protein [Propionivibrio sp.]